MTRLNSLKAQGDGRLRPGGIYRDAAPRALCLLVEDRTSEIFGQIGRAAPVCKLEKLMSTAFP